MTPRLGSALVATGSALAVLGAAHAAVNCVLMRTPRRDPPDQPGSLAVLIPARDEAARLGPCLQSVAAQTGIAAPAVIVLDDCSTDGTADLARSHGVEVISGTTPPTGWLGKAHACRQLADAAPPDAEYLVFLDADVRLSEVALAGTVALMREHDLDFCSPYPKQLTGTVAERLVQPLLQWSWLTTLPLRLAERTNRPSLCAANGQFLVVSRTAYLRAGGHAAVRDRVLDDIALARALRAVGAGGGFVDGSDIATCRMYTGAGDLAAGYRKSLWSAFGSPARAVATVAALILTYVVPAAAALRGSRVGALGYGAGVLGRVITARRTGGHAVPDALAHPVSILAFAGLTAASITDARRGRLTWRGRPVIATGIS